MLLVIKQAIYIIQRVFRRIFIIAHLISQVYVPLLFVICRITSLPNDPNPKLYETKFRPKRVLPEYI